jgi:hypothetical protein
VGIFLSVGGAPSLAAATAARSPAISISTVIYRRAGRTVDLHVRLCLSNGPGARLSVTERLVVHGVRKASDHWVDPTGVDLTHVYPYACDAAYQIAWVPKRRLSGPGVYTATIRVRDGLGKWSVPASFTVASP